MGYKLSAGVEAYYRNADFLSAVYAQENAGFALQTRQQVWRALSARTEYRFERVVIYDVGDNVDPLGDSEFGGFSGNGQIGSVIRDSAGTYYKSAVTGALVWDTRDSLFLTRKGEVVEFTGFLSGGFLGGTVQDYGLSLEASKYFPLPWDLIFLAKG
jgi:outer membrane protein insertion porin family